MQFHQKKLVYHWPYWISRVKKYVLIERWSLSTSISSAFSGLLQQTAVAAVLSLSLFSQGGADKIGHTVFLRK